MSFGLAFPLGLLALLGLALPLLVHLARREQQQPTDFAALRWLRAMRRPRQRLRLEQWLLLALRLALVAGLALLLAGPWFIDDRAGSTRVLVHPALPPPEAGEDVELRWLAPGFPPTAQAAPASRQPVASLLREADASLPAGTPLVVHVPAMLDGADGEHPRLSRPVQWRVAASPTPAAVPPDGSARTPVSMVVRHDTDHAAQARWLLATQRAWRASADTNAQAPTPAEPDAATLDAPWPPGTRVLAWLAAGDPPTAVLDFASEGGTVLLAHASTWPAASEGQVAWRGEDGTARLRASRFGDGRVLQFAQPLAPSVFPALLDPRFPAWLQAHLQTPPPPPRRVAAAHYAPLADGPAFAPAKAPLSPWLVVLLATLFLVERWLAAGQPARRPA